MSHTRETIVDIAQGASLLLAGGGLLAAMGGPAVLAARAPHHLTMAGTLTTLFGLIAASVLDNFRSVTPPFTEEDKILAKKARIDLNL